MDSLAEVQAQLSTLQAQHHSLTTQAQTDREVLLGLRHVEAEAVRLKGQLQALGGELEGLRAKLSAADCVYVDGGNTFFLRHYMSTSGFDRCAMRPQSSTLNPKP